MKPLFAATLFFALLALAAACDTAEEAPPTAHPTATPSPAPTATATLMPASITEDEIAIYAVEVATAKLWKAPGTVWSPDGKLLTGTSCCIGTGGLDLFDPAVGQTTRIYDGDIAEVAWSPDGSQLAFQAAQKLYLINRDGSGLRQLSIQPVRALAWSPNGDSIAAESGGHVRLVDIATGRASTITDEIGAAYYIGFLAWSPDGSRLAFTGDYRATEAAEGRTPLYVYEVASQTLTEVAEPVSGPILWSPDGSNIATRLGQPVPFPHDPNLSLPLYHLVSLDRPAEPTPLPPARNATWSPDGRRIAYLSEGCITGEWDIYTIEPGDGSVRQLTNAPEGAKEGPVWSPGGHTIAYSTFDNLILVDAGSGGARTLVVSGRPGARGPSIHLHGSDWGGSPWSPDGRYIVFGAGGDHGICD